MCIDGVLMRCQALGRAPGPRGLSQGSLENYEGGSQERAHVAEGKAQAKNRGGDGLPEKVWQGRGSLCCPLPRPQPLALRAHLGSTGLKSYLPTNTRKAKALKAASPLASPVRSSLGSPPRLPVRRVSLRETVPRHQMPDVCVCLCVCLCVRVPHPQTDLQAWTESDSPLGCPLALPSLG